MEKMIFKIKQMTRTFYFENWRCRIRLQSEKLKGQRSDGENTEMKPVAMGDRESGYYGNNNKGPNEWLARL